MDELPIVQRTYDLVKWYVPFLNRLPRNHKFMLGERIITELYELELVMADMRDIRLDDAIKPIKNQYDFILIDCPPSLGLLSYISLVASDYVLVPIQTQYKAFCGTELLLGTVARVKKRANRNLKIVGFVPTMYAKSNSQDSRALQAIQEQMAEFGTIFAPIPRSTAFADAVEKHQPLIKYNSRHPAVKPLKQLAQAISKLT